MDKIIKLTPGEKFANRYRIVDIIGKGPVGVVYKALDLALDLPVAVKLLDPELFVGEFEQVNTIRLYRARAYKHKNILEIYEVQPGGETPFIVSALAQGLTLRQVFDFHHETGELFTVMKIRAFTNAIADALKAIHSVGVHGNLKPENIFILSTQLTIGDPYYIRKRRLKEGEEIPLYDYYRAPEQLTEPKKEFTASDIFALGLIFGELVSNNPVKPEIPLSEQTPRLTNRFDELFIKATQVDPHKRYEEIDDFMSDLEEALDYVEKEGLWERKNRVTGAFKAAPIELEEKESKKEKKGKKKLKQEKTKVEVPKEKVEETKVEPIKEKVEVQKKVEEEKTRELEVDVEEEKTVAVTGVVGEEVAQAAEEEEEDITSEIPVEKLPAKEEEEEPPQIPEEVVVEEEIPAIPVEEVEEVQEVEEVPEVQEVTEVQELNEEEVIEAPGVESVEVIEMEEEPQDVQTTIQDVQEIEKAAGAKETEPKKMAGFEKIKKEDAGKAGQKDDKKKVYIWVGVAVAVLFIVLLIALIGGGSGGNNEEKKHKENVVAVKDAVAGRDVVKDVKKNIKDAKKDVVKDKVALKDVTEDKSIKDVKVKEDAAKKEGKKKAENKVANVVPPKKKEQPQREKGYVYAEDLVCPAGMAKIVLKKKMKKDKSFKPSKMAYCIDRYEYPGKGKDPVGNVSRSRAASLCRRAGKRLCTASEWVRACGPKYSYGSEFKKDYCNVGTDAIVPSGTYSRCKSPYGVYDMIGNVEEWVANNRLYGGSASSSGIASGSAVTCRRSTKRFFPNKYSGFRCCATPKLKGGK